MEADPRFHRGCSSGVEHLLAKQRAAGAKPAIRSKHHQQPLAVARTGRTGYAMSALAAARGGVRSRPSILVVGSGERRGLIDPGELADSRQRVGS